jgi:hypothetical protein
MIDFTAYHTVSSARARLGVTRQQIHNLIEAGTLVGELIEPYPGGKPIYRIERASVEHYAANRPPIGRPRKPPTDA